MNKNRMSHVLRVKRLSVLVDLVKKLRLDNHKDDQIMIVLEDYIDRKCRLSVPINYQVGYTTKWDYIQAAVKTA